MKRTNWFNAATQNPVRVGVYEVKIQLGIAYSRWDGKQWFCAEFNHYFAVVQNEPSVAMYKTGAKWRGLTKESK